MVPAKSPIRCHSMHGNCVLIHHSVVEKIGNIDATFTHGAGDLDYGLRAIKQDCHVWAAPGYMGTCRIDVKKSWYDLSMPFFKRIQEMNKPTGRPLKDWKVFHRRHSGIFWPLYWLGPYWKLFI